MKTMLKKKRIKLGDLTDLKIKFREADLNTVCESAKCPNIGECFGKKIATFLIAGNICTRGCTFCAIEKGNPKPVDAREPGRVASTIRNLGLRYAVITSVTRDDMSDGGARHFFDTVAEIRKLCPATKVEILVPDFRGNMEAAEVSFSSKPDVFSHNIETVPRLYETARRGADYKRSLQLLSWAKNKGLTTKSGIMLGLGEQPREIMAVFRDLRKAGCDLLTIGQYLAPSKKHHPVKDYIQPDKFDFYRKAALKLGFKHVMSGPYVRSSYLADQMLDQF
jgi:lipoic acid synthetase